MGIEISTEATGNKFQIKEGLFFYCRSFPPLESNKEDTYERLISYTGKGSPLIKLQFELSITESTVNGRNKTAHEIYFEFHDTYLQSFTGKGDTLWEKEFSSIADGQEFPVCCNTRMMLYEVLKNSDEGIMRKIFLESKALSLLLCTHDCYAGSEPECFGCKFLENSYDKEKIIKAKEYLLNNLDKPITIPELSRLVGINQCYLKKGFKELFGSTIFDFVQEQRILKAKMLLATGQISVAEVAENVGYSNVSNFSNAFKKLTGISPKEVQKN